MAPGGICFVKCFCNVCKELLKWFFACDFPLFWLRVRWFLDSSIDDGEHWNCWGEDGRGSVMLNHCSLSVHDDVHDSAADDGCGVDDCAVLSSKWRSDLESIRRWRPFWIDSLTEICGDLRTFQYKCCSHLTLAELRWLCCVVGWRTCLPWWLSQRSR